MGLGVHVKVLPMSRYGVKWGLRQGKDRHEVLLATCCSLKRPIKVKVKFENQGYKESNKRQYLLRF